MRATGIVRRVDDLLRIAIPREIARRIGIREGTPLELFIEDGDLVFRKYSAAYELKDSLSVLKNTFDNSKDSLEPECVSEIESCIKEIESALSNIE